jgi:hypothetical protein
MILLLIKFLRVKKFLLPRHLVGRGRKLLRNLFWIYKRNWSVLFAVRLSLKGLIVATLMVVPYICSPCGHGACGPCSIFPYYCANQSINGVKSQIHVPNVVRNCLLWNHLYETTC